MDVVVSFRALPSAGFVDRAKALDERATSLRGRRVAAHGRELAYAFAELNDALRTATGAAHDEWAVGMAEGELETLFDGVFGGVALETARMLAAVARIGEVFADKNVKAVSSGELLSNGSRLVAEGTLRVRGHRLHVDRPWKKQAIEQLSHMRVATLVGVEPLAEPIPPGQLLVIRADPGAGGSRFLGELASSTPRSLLVTPSGSGYEPFGALRRSLARSITRELNPKLLELAVPLEKLLAGDSLPMDTASKLVSAYLHPRTPNELGLLVMDEVRSMDPATLEACVRSARSSSTSFALCARLDAAGQLPSILAMLPSAGERELAPLDPDAAAALASGCTNDALDRSAKKRWARLGGNVPLGIIEAVSWGIQSGDIVWHGDVASPSTHAAGRGKPRSPAEWIAVRAREQSMPARIVLCLVALLGGEAKVSRLVRILVKWAQGWDVEEIVQSLIAERWLFDTEEGWVGLPSKTHCAALSVLLDDVTRIPLHAAAAVVIEDEELAFGRVEAAWHAAKAKDIGHASKLLLAAAKATASVRLDTSTTQLIALARRVDPSCEDAALELLSASLDMRTSMRPAPVPSFAPSVASAPPPEEAALVPSPPAPEVISSPKLSPEVPSSPDLSTTPDLSAAREIAMREVAARSAPPAPLAPIRAPMPAMPDGPDAPDPSSTTEWVVPSGVVAASERMVQPDVVVAPDNPPVPFEPEASSAVHEVVAELEEEHPDSEPPTLARLESSPSLPPLPVLPKPSLPPPAPASASIAPPSSGGPPSEGANLAARLGELAKEALLTADNAALEKYVDGLRAAGEDPILADRMTAMARLGRGEIGDALRLIRRTRSKLDPQDHKRRCQTSLQLGVALSLAGRMDEALLEGLDALGRARQIQDEHGARACLAFLSKLYRGTGRVESSERLRTAPPII